MRRAVRIAAWTGGSLALLLGVLLAALMIAGNTDPGRRLLEGTVFRLTAGNVRLTGLAGTFPSHLQLEKLELVDDRGIWLTAEKIAVDWTPLAYLGARLQIDDLRVARLAMERLPHSSSPSTTEPAIPRIDAARIHIDVLYLGAPLAGVPASLTASGSAHLRSVSDMLFDASIQRVGGDGSYELHLQFDAKQMNASLQVEEPANGPLANIFGLPGLGAVSASARLSGLRSAEQLAVVLQAGAVHGKANGTFSLTDLSADLGFDFDSQAMTPRPDLHWDGAALHGRWQGSVKSPAAQGRLQVAGLELPGGTQLGALDADLQAQAGTATLDAIARGLRIPGPQPELLVADPIKLNASLRLDDAKLPFTLVASQRLFALRGDVELSGDRRVRLNLRLPDLKPLAALAGQEVRGTAELKLDFLGDSGAAQWVLDAKANLDPGKQAWAAAVGDSAALHLAGGYKGRSVSIDALKFAGRALTASAAGTWAQDNARLRFEGELPDLRALSPALAGSLKASGTLDGPMTSFNLNADATASLALRGSPAGVLTAQVRSRGLPSNPGGSLKADGSLDGAPLHVDVALERGVAGALRVLVREAAWRSAHGDGDLTVAKGSGQSRGQVRLSMTDLKDLQDLLGVEISGAVTAAMSLHSDRQHTYAQLQFDTQRLTVAQLGGDIHLSGEGATDAFAFKSALILSQWRGDPAAVSAAGVLNLEHSEVGLSSLIGSYRGQELRLLAPAKILFGNGLSVDGLRLGAQQAELQVRGRVSPELDLRVSLQGLQPALINIFATDLLAAGRIEAQAELHGSPQAPVGKLSMTASGIQMADDAALGLPAADLHVDAKLNGASADLEAQLDAGSASQLKATGRVPLDQAGAIEMKVNGLLDVGLINPFLEARGQHASGKLAIDASVGGNYAAPQIGGSVDLTQGSLRDYGRGVSLSDVAAQIVGNAGTLQIKSLTASAPPGKLTMTGSVGVLEAGLPLDIQLVASNAQPIVSKLITANLDADLHIVGKARERLDVSGKVHLNRTLIGIPNGLPPNVAVLDVRRRGKAVVPTPSKALSIGLDVAVQAPSQILVQGRGLDAEMGGDLHIGGTTDEPQVSGGFDLERGSFSLASNKLNFTAGRVGFNGVGVKTRVDPTLDFTAQSTVGDVTAILRITGVADAPVFEFSSSPALPQDEIMARLLFGENAAQLSALQLAQIGAALATLSGVGGDGGLNPLVKIQKSLGLDRLTLGSGTTNTATGTENAGASIEAGRYISKRVYVAAKQSTQGASQLEADVDLTKHLKLQTKLGNGTASVQGTTPENDPGSSIGLSYQFEY